MSITDTDKVDIVSTRPDASIVKLVIGDHLDWDDFETHALLLQDKINTYLTFIETGQIHRIKSKVPDHAELHIVLAAQCTPSAEAEALFGQIREFLERVGIAFDVKVDRAGGGAVRVPPA